MIKETLQETSRNESRLRLLRRRLLVGGGGGLDLLVVLDVAYHPHRDRKKEKETKALAESKAPLMELTRLRVPVCF